MFGLTDAVRILRQRMAAGEPLLIPVTTEADETVSTRSIPTGISAIPDPSNPPADVVPPKGLSDWARMKDLAIKTRDNSHKWLEVGRSIRSGETEVRLSGLLGTIRGEEVCVCEGLQCYSSADMFELRLRIPLLDIFVSRVDLAFH